MKPVQYLYSFSGILAREFQRSIQQRTRFVSALVRPLLWLAVFAAGFRSALEGVVVPPHAAPVDYEIYITPGLVGIVVLFNSMQSSLSMVYDREMGSMRVLLTSPMPRSWLLVCKLIASALVSLVPVYGFLLLARLFDVLPPVQGYLAALPAVVLTAVMLGALGLILASVIEQLENFAGVMNFVVFPLFFLSSALYPLTAMRNASEWIYWACLLNPFTHAVELIRHSLWLDFSPSAFGVTMTATLVLILTAVVCFDPAKKMIGQSL